MSDPEDFLVSPCMTCPKPGACCHDFMLSTYFEDDRDVHEQWAEKKQRATRHDDEVGELPFVPLRRVRTFAIDDQGHTKSLWRFTCPKLGPDGRCMIYQTRPFTCRDYRPLTDSLCVRFVGPPHPEASSAWFQENEVPS